MADHDRIDGENMPIPVGVPFDPSKQTVGLARTGEACFIAPTGGPPRRIDGYSVSAPIITQDPPHVGEMHPDADELLFVVSGSFTVSLELATEIREIEMGARHALIATAPRTRARARNCTDRLG